MKLARRNIKNSAAAAVTLLVALILQLLFWFKAAWPAGGQDSWNHYLFARFAPKHPELYLDQWGKPVFTLVASPFAQFGIAGIYILNLACTLGAAWLLYLTARRLNFRLPWLASFFFLFQPIVFGNTISGLTEPLTAFALSLSLYLFSAQRFTAAAVLVSFFPFFRSEGIILWVAALLFLGIRTRWKSMLWLFFGLLLIAVVGAVVSGDYSWILSHNPYFRAEIEQRFAIGHGDFFHYLHSQRQIWGIWITFLSGLALALLAAHIVYLFRNKTPEEKSRFCFWLVAPMFLGFFLAHSWMWYKGAFGSHGLLRVFVLAAPLAALLAQYAIDKLVSLDIKWVKRLLVVAGIVVMLPGAYQGSETPFPWKNKPSVAAFPGEPQIDLALNYIKQHGLKSKVLVHQLPWLNAKLAIDPWAKPEDAATFYAWSIDKRPGKDWMPDSTVVLWDNFHARRDAPMTLGDIKQLTQYSELAYFPASDTNYDVRVFLKTEKKP